MRTLATLWRLTGAEALCAAGMGFLLPLAVHVPLQLASLAVALANLQPMCQASQPAVMGDSCIYWATASVSLLGFLMPTICVRVVEQRCRATFARLVLCAAQEAS